MIFPNSKRFFHDQIFHIEGSEDGEKYEKQAQNPNVSYFAMRLFFSGCAKTCKNQVPDRPGLRFRQNAETNSRATRSPKGS